jgi:hypothetical protein
MVGYACHPRYEGSIKGGSQPKLAPAKINKTKQQQRCKILLEK